MTLFSYQPAESHAYVLQSVPDFDVDQLPSAVPVGLERLLWPGDRNGGVAGGMLLRSGAEAAIRPCSTGGRIRTV